MTWILITASMRGIFVFASGVTLMNDAGCAGHHLCGKCQLRYRVWRRKVSQRSAVDRIMKTTRCAVLMSVSMGYNYEVDDQLSVINIRQSRNYLSSVGHSESHTQNEAVWRSSPNSAPRHCADCVEVCRRLGNIVSGQYCVSARDEAVVPKQIWPASGNGRLVRRTLSSWNCGKYRWR